MHIWRGSTAKRSQTTCCPLSIRVAEPRRISFRNFGFRVDRWQEFADALKRQAASHGVARVVETPFAPRYHVDGAIETPDGRNPWVRTVWQIDLGSDYPRLITAHPRRR